MTPTFPQLHVLRAIPAHTSATGNEIAHTLHASAKKPRHIVYLTLAELLAAGWVAVDNGQVPARWTRTKEGTEAVLRMTVGFSKAA